MQTILHIAPEPQYTQSQRNPHIHHYQQPQPPPTLTTTMPFVTAGWTPPVPLPLHSLLHGTSRANTPQRDRTKPYLDKDGAIGRHFKLGGAVGRVTEKLGGPFAYNGRIGRMWNPEAEVEVGERGVRAAKRRESAEGEL